VAIALALHARVRVFDSRLRQQRQIPFFNFFFFIFAGAFLAIWQLCKAKFGVASVAYNNSFG
jgi:hypothetical protein